MKKRLLRFLLGICYICLVAAFLIAHIQSIDGPFHRAMALIETMALAIFAGVILFLYIKLKERTGAQEKRDYVVKSEATVKKAEDVPKKRVTDGREPEVLIRTEDQFAKRVEANELSDRELEVAWLLYRGYTNRQIGEELFIAETTVKKHVTHIYEKMQITGRKEFKEKVKNS